MNNFLAGRPWRPRIEGKILNQVQDDILCNFCKIEKLGWSSSIKRLNRFRPAKRFVKWDYVPAFTLAEVLITLGIIGIVAAMTMPVLITKYQKKVTVVKLQKAYTTLAQAVEKAKAKYGDISGWDYTYGNDINSDSQKQMMTKFAKTYITPHMVISEDCGYKNEKNCKNARVCNKYCVDIADGYYIITPDARYSISQDNNTGKSINRFRVKIDINGNEGPNLFGRDVFDGFIEPTRNRFEFIGAELLFTREQMLKDTTGWGCNKESALKMYCGAIIQIDGWQIKDDYPW